MAHFIPLPSFALRNARLIAAAILAVLTIGQAPAHAQNCEYHAEADGWDCAPGGQRRAEPPASYVALAVSADGKTASGHHPSSAAGARSQAMAACSRQGGRRCIIIATGPETCYALAVSVTDRVFALSRPIGAGWAVRSDALQQCTAKGGRSCSVAISACSDGTDGGHTGTRTVIMRRRQ